MFKRILRIFVVVLILMAVLWFGGTSIYKLGHDIEFKRPSQVFEPLASRFGLSLNFNTTSNNIGSIIVSADNETPAPTHRPSEHGGTTTTNPPVTNPPASEVPITTEPVITEQPDESSNPNTEPAISVTAEDLDLLISTIRVSNEESSTYNLLTFEIPLHRFEYNGNYFTRFEYTYLTSKFLMSMEPFEYKCPYTGIKIKDITKLNLDNIIDIGYILKYGDISDWTPEKCNAYAYTVCLCVQGKANIKKSNNGPADWLPDVNIEDYCYTWLLIASEWDIALRQEDINICRLQCLNAISSGHNLNRL